MKYKNFLIISLIALILNIIWEFSHHPLYVHLASIPEYLHLVTASFTDMLIIQGMIAIVSLKNQNLSWLKHPQKSDYLIVVLLGLTIAILIEVINIDLGRWAYTDAMPTIFNIGITPLIQLALTGALSLAISAHIIKNNTNRP
ncbi:hypothetical protein CVV38_02535 [Candidatus Peregrinibacteria bacterium HGW-Peregrinibacteria-1]|jgi:hypothetical protein|nr:MAG: hypothetical protein CVV38_02535 [Candidatus Peregrinibacteria bacterium HGW-Peregrinibacteria-1]